MRGPIREAERLQKVAEFKRRQQLRKIFVNKFFFQSKFYRISVFSRIFFIVFVVIIFIGNHISFFDETQKIVFLEQQYTEVEYRTGYNYSPPKYTFFHLITSDKTHYEISDDAEHSASQISVGDEVIIKKDILNKPISFFSNKLKKSFYIDDALVNKYILACIALFGLFLFFQKDVFKGYLDYHLHFFFIASFIFTLSYLFNFTLNKFLKNEVIILYLIVPILLYLYKVINHKVTQKKKRSQKNY